MTEQKIKQVGIDIGRNIRRIRLEKGYGQTDFVRMLQLKNVDITRETLVKIERGIQHITGSQLRGIRDCLDTTYNIFSIKNAVSHYKADDIFIYLFHGYFTFHCLFP